MKLVLLLATVFLASCSAKTILNKTENLTCLGFCTSTKVEHDVENHPPKDAP